MKLIRFGKKNQEKPGVLHSDGERYDVSSICEEFNEQFFEMGGLQKLEQNFDPKNLPLVQKNERWGSPIARPSKIICIGLNFSDHAEESNMTPPDEPVIFFKSSSALCGPHDPLYIPKGSTQTDWEVELAVVIGKKALYVQEEEASEYIAGYTLHNDYSERGYQLERSGQWVKGKSFDHFAPLGPYMSTKEEVVNVDDLPMWLKVNNISKQNGNTKNLIFKIPYLIHYLSQFMTLLPGDVISTGTPAGVGLGFNPPQYIKEGDQIELGIDGLGVQSQVAYKFDNREEI